MAGMTVLPSTLLPALAGRYPDRGDAVTVDDDRLSSERLRGAAAALADRIAGAPAVAVLAEPTMHTVVAVAAGLLAGVPVVPVAPDAGPLERDHVLADCAAPLLLAGPDIDLTGRSDT